MVPVYVTCQCKQQVMYSCRSAASGGGNIAHALRHGQGGGGAAAGGGGFNTKYRRSKAYY